MRTRKRTRNAPRIIEKLKKNAEDFTAGMNFEEKRSKEESPYKFYCCAECGLHTTEELFFDHLMRLGSRCTESDRQELSNNGSSDYETDDTEEYEENEDNVIQSFMYKYGIEEEDFARLRHTVEDLHHEKVATEVKAKV